MNREEIKEQIMHRGNMLLLDSVEFDGKRAVSLRQVREDDVFLVSVNGKKAFPSFLLPEVMAQTSLFTAQPKGRLPLLLGIRDLTIDGYAFVGQTMKIEAECDYFSGSAGQTVCTVFCEGKQLAKGKILFCLKEGNAT